MKYNNSRLSLKQRWLSFALCILIALLAGIFALYSYIEAYPFWTSACSLLVCAIMLFIAIFLLRLNMRRKRIQREFVSEFDKEIREKGAYVSTLRGPDGIGKYLCKMWL